MIQEKLGLNGALKNTLPRLKYNQERFGNNEDWSLFIEEKSQTSRWGFDRSS